MIGIVSKKTEILYIALTNSHVFHDLILWNVSVWMIICVTAIFHSRSNWLTTSARQLVFTWTLFMTAGIPLWVWVNMCLFVHSEAFGQLSSANGLQREWSLEGDGTTVSGDFRGHPDSCSSGHLHCADFNKSSRWDHFHWVQSIHWNHLKVTRKIMLFIHWKTICCQIFLLKVQWQWAIEVFWQYNDFNPSRYEKEVALLEINIRILILYCFSKY